jgi:hypothetical protein
MNSFYRAVVEDNVDPQKRGRVRVRIWGLHTEKKIKTEKEGIPTEELPWAEPCIPIFEGGISGFGMFGVPVQGSHVMIFFEAGNYFAPRYFASMPSTVPEELPDKRQGFSDPRGQYPFATRLGEPDWHRLARDETNETLITSKNNNRIKDVQVAAGGKPFAEPVSPYNSVYPNNWVFTTHGGLTLELDSTPGSKRFHLWHPSDTYIECDDQGTLVIRNNKSRYDLTKEDHFEYTMGRRELSVDGDSGKRSGGKYSRETGTNEDIIIGGNKTETITGNKTETITGTKTETMTGIAQMNGAAAVTLSSAGVLTLQGATVALAGTTLSMSFAGTGTSASTGAMVINGSSVHLNKP